MKFNNQSNNRDAVNINSRGLQFMNGESTVMASTLVYGYWNSMVSIKIHPALPEDKQTESSRFNYDEVLSTALTLEKAQAILKFGKESILPAYNEGTKKSRFVKVGGNSILGIGTEQRGGEQIAYITIFKNLDEETKKPEAQMLYQFKSSYSIDDYDPETGNYTITKGIPSEFMLFLSALEASIEALTYATAHSIKVSDKWFRDRLINDLGDIAAKLGVEGKSKSYSNGNGGGYKTKDIFSDGGSKSNEPVDLDGGNAPISKLNNLDELQGMF